ncbi:MAG: ABC transporter ATP-binding protein [Bradyrhizobiaceae bacterium]|nr:ABC transporter ATP-binding protein [Bradyrhizobiaceae bacterium]
MITTSSIIKTFRNRNALNNVSVEFPEQCVTAIVGPNGSGKTTLMKIILGLMRPTSGSFTIMGQPGVNNAAAREHMGYMAQIARYPENLTVSEVIAMIRSLRSDAPTVNVDDLIRRFALEQHLGKPMRALSGGTRQKVSAVLAFMFKPSILLLDEPTAGLDPISTARLKESIVEARNAGTAIIVTSHLLSELQEISDRVVYLQDGEVLHNGSVHTLMQQTSTDSLTDAILTLMERGAA